MEAAVSAAVADVEVRTQEEVAAASVAMKAAAEAQQLRELEDKVGPPCGDAACIAHVRFPDICLFESAPKGAPTQQAEKMFTCRWMPFKRSLQRQQMPSLLLRLPCSESPPNACCKRSALLLCFCFSLHKSVFTSRCMHAGICR